MQVLIVGPIGIGKELFAHAVHAVSPRSSGPFACLKCAAIPRDLLGYPRVLAHTAPYISQLPIVMNESVRSVWNHDALNLRMT